MHARDVAEVAEKLEIARKLLLRLFHDHYPIAAGHKRCPKKSVAELKKLL